MSAQRDNPAQADPSITVSGRLPQLSSNNLSRVSAFLVQDNKVVIQSPVSAGGTFQFRLSGRIVIDPCAVVVLGPRGVDESTLMAHGELPRLSLKATAEREATAKADFITLNFSAESVNDKIIDLWWIWCRTYTVSGVLQTANGCPIPGADVTVYNVTCGPSGPVEAPIETVQTNADGQFTATFNWCECVGCWPCWPIWWHCWPWWWELDILAVIESVERQLPLAAAYRPGAPVANVAPMRRPVAADLMTGQGFPRASAVLERDESRTALIASKFANPHLRELFPWWWWCCENPNLVFSATQNGNLILNEDPSTSTRWCFESGQSAALTGNSQSIGVCPPPPVCEGFAWVSVGNLGTTASPTLGVPVNEITNGYANGHPGTDASNMAFAGYLNIFGGFSDQTIPFYKVFQGLWTGNANPARGGGKPKGSAAISLPLTATVVVYRAATHSMEFDNVVLGPCSYAGIDNLYMTTSQRANPPAGVTGLPISPAAGSFPVLNPGDFVVTWSNSGLIVGAPASALTGASGGGGVDLTLVAYDATGTQLSLVTNNPLTLMIDTSGLSKQQIDSFSAFDVNGNPVSSTTGADCPSYHIGPNGYVVLHVVVSDADTSPTLSLNEHLYEYEILTQFGHGLTSVNTQPGSRGYAQATSTFTPRSLPSQAFGIDPGYVVPNTAEVSFVGGGDSIQINPTVSCCYDFQLWAGKRVTDGQTFACTLGNVDFWTASIDVS